MNVSSYLPSAQFVLIILSLALSGCLVLTANYITKRAEPAHITTSSSAQGSVVGNWEATLNSIQAAVADDLLPEAPNQNILTDMLTSAKSNNITDSVGKTLLINLTSAKAQGLGNDIPTQDSLISGASSQFSINSSKLYAFVDINVVDDSTTTLHAYGNAVIDTLAKHVVANPDYTVLVIGYMTDKQDTAQIATLKKIEIEYRALLADLVLLRVPRTLAPLHLQIVNDYAKEAGSFADMEVVLEDPLRGLGGLRQYQASVEEARRVFTNIAQALARGGILFNKDEPGALWAFVAPQ